MSKRLQYKYYGVFAVNPNDPSDFYGYCENSFSMGWFRDHVCAWQGRSAAQYQRQNACNSYHPSQRQFDWNWAKNYPKHIPHGYILKIYRLNSNKCPYAVDFNYRMAETDKKLPFKKWMYRNPKCKYLGSFEPNEFLEWSDKKPAEYSGKKVAIKNKVDMDKIHKQDYKQYEQQKHAAKFPVFRFK